MSEQPTAPSELETKQGTYAILSRAASFLADRQYTLQESSDAGKVFRFIYQMAEACKADIERLTPKTDSIPLSTEAPVEAII